MKRGQIEMAGLVVIVILITLGMLFMAMFALKGKESKKIFTRKELAYSTMSALMKTTVECGELKLSLQGDVLEDCVVHPKGSLRGDYSCDGMHSCDFFEVTATRLLNETLVEWKKRYDLQVVLGSRRVLEMVSPYGDCRARERDTSKPFPLETDLGTVQSVLYVCD